jgi:hypothetical protein
VFIVFFFLLSFYFLNREIRQAIVEAFGYQQFKHEQTLKLLIKSLSSDSVDIRFGAVVSLRSSSQNNSESYKLQVLVLAKEQSM